MSGLEDGEVKFRLPLCIVVSKPRIVLADDMSNEMEDFVLGSDRPSPAVANWG